MEKMMKSNENMNESRPAYGYIKNLAHNKYLKFGYDGNAYVADNHEKGGEQRYKWTLSAGVSDILGEIYIKDQPTPGYLYFSSEKDGDDFLICAAYNFDFFGEGETNDRCLFYFESPRDSNDGWLIKTHNGHVLKAGYDDKGDNDNQVYATYPYLQGDRRFLWVIEPA